MMMQKFVERGEIGLKMKGKTRRGERRGRAPRRETGFSNTMTLNPTLLCVEMKMTEK